MGAKLSILYMAPPSLIGILYIGGYIVIVLLLLLCVFRMILNKGTLNIPQEYIGGVISFSYLCSMKQLPHIKRIL